MIEVEQTCEQTKSSREVLERIRKLVPVIEDLIWENQKELRVDQAALYAATFLEKKYAAQQVAPTLSQLMSYVAEFNQRACHVAARGIKVTNQTLIRICTGECNRPAADFSQANSAETDD